MNTSSILNNISTSVIITNEFMEIVDKELKEVWGETKEKNQEKLSWNSNRHKDKISDNEGTFKGVFT